MDIHRISSYSNVHPLIILQNPYSWLIICTDCVNGSNRSFRYKVSKLRFSVDKYFTPENLDLVLIGDFYTKNKKVFRVCTDWQLKYQMFSGNFFFLLQWKILSTGEVREARFDWQELTKTPRQPSSSTAVVGKAGFKDQRLNETWSWWATAAEVHRRFHTCQEPNSDVPLGTCLWKLGGWSIFLLRPQTWHWRQETLTQPVRRHQVTRAICLPLVICDL